MRMPDTCHRLSRYDLDSRQRRCDFTFWGKIESEACIPYPHIEYVDYTVANLLIGDFRVVVHFADGDSLVHVVAVGLAPVPAK